MQHPLSFPSFLLLSSPLPFLPVPSPQRHEATLSKPARSGEASAVTGQESRPQLHFAALYACKTRLFATFLVLGQHCNEWPNKSQPRLRSNLQSYHGPRAYLEGDPPSSKKILQRMQLFSCVVDSNYCRLSALAPSHYTVTVALNSCTSVEFPNVYRLLAILT